MGPTLRRDLVPRLRKIHATHRDKPGGKEREGQQLEAK
jgi:hypothetical protein